MELLASAVQESFLSGQSRSRRGASQTKRTLGEQLLVGRHERALERFNEQQAKWESFRQVAAKRTGRSKEDLVVTRAEEHRERLEVMQLLDRATPAEEKGANSWYHSLRGEGTRYVQVGNMFSGLHLPIKLHPEESLQEIVRKPLLTELITNRDTQAGKHKKRTWRDDEYLQARIRRYRKRMEELAPGQLEMHEMLEPEVVRINPGVQEAEAGNHAIDELVGADEGFEDPDIFHSLQGSPQVGRAVSSGSGSAQGSMQRQGPHLEVLPDRLQFKGLVGKLCLQRLRLRNVGTAVVNYEWVMQEVQHCFQESVLLDDTTRNFTCHETRGRILPGEEVCAVFAFSSATPGAFTATWRLNTYPELVVPVADLHLHGLASEDDLLRERREGFRSAILQQQVLHQAEELVEDIVGAVELQPPPPPDLSLPEVQQRVFEDGNAALGLHYTPHAWQRFLHLSEELNSLKQKMLQAQEAPAKGAAPSSDTRPAPRGRRPVQKVLPKPMPRAFPLEMGPLPAQQLRAELARLPADAEGSKARLQLELEREVRAAQKPPAECSPLWWHAYEAVSQVVLDLPDRWSAARSAAGLEAPPFLPWPKQDAAPEALERRAAAAEQRRAKLGSEEQEEEVRNSFVEAFARQHFGPAVARFDMAAKEVSFTARIQRGCSTSLHERFKPYLQCPKVNSFHIGGTVVLYDLNLTCFNHLADAVKRSPEAAEGVMLPLPLEEAANGTRGSTDEPGETSRQASDQGVPDSVEVTPPPPAAVPDDAAGGSALVNGASIPAHVRRCLEGVNTVLEYSPLSLLVSAHLGEPLPETPPPDGVEAAQPTGLFSLEPLLGPLRELLKDISSSVEFVPQEAWLADREAFAKRVRDSSQERKVFLLENLSAVPEELGFRCAQRDGVVERHNMAWAEREGWAKRVLAGSLQPDFVVVDSFSAACKSLTSQEGKWEGAPKRVAGPSVEREIIDFLDVLHLPHKMTDADTVPQRARSEVGSNKGRLPAPLLLVVGGGGFSKAGGTERLLQKLEMLLGLKWLSAHERDGLILALGGELAACVLKAFFGALVASVGYTADMAIDAALRETFLEILSVGVEFTLPQDVVPDCEAPGDAGSPPVAVPLADLFQDGRPTVAYMGSRDGREWYARLDVVSGAVSLTDSPGQQQPASTSADGRTTAPGQLVVRDVGPTTLDSLGRRLRSCRGVLWNGALGAWDEHECWRTGTKGFIQAVEARLYVESGDEDRAVETEDGRPASQPVVEPDSEFEVAVVIGEDSPRILSSVMESPELVTFLSQSGEGLLRVLRGQPVPGLLACSPSA